MNKEREEREIVVEDETGGFGGKMKDILLYDIRKII